jgi:hypothetical protein
MTELKIIAQQPIKHLDVSTPPLLRVLGYFKLPLKFKLKTLTNLTTANFQHINAIHHQLIAVITTTI